MRFIDKSPIYDNAQRNSVFMLLNMSQNTDYVVEGGIEKQFRWGSVKILDNGFLMCIGYMVDDV